MITVAHTCSALLIAIDNINPVCEIGLYNVLVTSIEMSQVQHCQLFHKHIMVWPQFLDVTGEDVNMIVVGIISWGEHALDTDQLPK